jgi:thioredoxin-related protein
MKTKEVFFLFICFGFFFVGCSEKSEHKSKTPLHETKKDTLKTISGLRWYLDIEEAFKKAKEEKKNLVVMVGEESCRWCKKMKERTLTDRRIQEKLKSYILVSVKRSDKNAIKHLHTFDGNIPSFFFMKEDKELVGSIVGYFRADDFLEYIDEVEE